MISPEVFFQELRFNGITKFAGVPDSLLKSFCAYVSDNSDSADHMITANEGSAVGLAAGQYIATGKPSLVYMQNSGFGNTINPLLSLADPLVYSVPMLLMVGWRGEPGVKDEPQHLKQGAVMEALFEACEIPYRVLSAENEDVASYVKEMTTLSISKKCPVVMLVKKDAFSPYKLQKNIPDVYEMTRESAISEIVNRCDEDDLFVSTTGMPSRELFEIRVKNGQSHEKDFLTVGSMGHASMIALGIASSRLNQRVVCIDGDGASIMHLGNMTTLGQSGCNNLIHILLNNGAHDSVGGQPTCAYDINLPEIAKASGYGSVMSISHKDAIASAIKNCGECAGPYFIEIKIKKGARGNLGRPTSSPHDNIIAMIDFIGSK